MKGFSDKYVESIIKRTIKGSMTIRDSAIRLGISRQYMYRLVERYGKEGASCLSHGNKEMQRAWKTDEDVEYMVVDLYRKAGRVQQQGQGGQEGRLRLQERRVLLNPRKVPLDPFRQSFIPQKNVKSKFI